MKRLSRFEQVADQMIDHIRNTVRQYGDYPDDQLTGYTVEDCIKHIQRYCNRYGNDPRGRENERLSFLKIIHYASEAWLKMEEEYQNMPQINPDCPVIKK